ncbi:MAG: hypothetical protein A2848_02795 [Candidatus Magasanikbacteria bacterium RIFCSPHIGHO2_01_FULL_50_8]|uniref:DUF4012 domain-containing protein n=2 Tax=Candidatus Magasanikiibacteriota TaxID=1752731 RepID=A0A1F6LME7_9BACT|nr:MAG: hypothetical protein A2848_02795 [Candidatus Magasanikbacteria bacterium RIFCSPHIGHO2_01_FULL_50_8]OGH68262.1 MAG: hypothetical protein A3C15_03935 [Candidatus Magasanikbacteria bacterium RIFCSPHIGHO2_02_FULL_50_9b]
MITIVLIGFFALVGIARSRYQTAVTKSTTESSSFAAATAGVIPTLLGFDSPRTILLLFLNNTEIRPGGGFIGSYGVVTLDRGVVTSLFTDGTENLDRGTPATYVIEPPQPIKNYLISRWFFRDANWSPDFAESSKKALEFYAAEGGQDAAKITTVIGVTPDVVETLLTYTGPITARGKTFTAENITDLLEHTVEIDFLQKGIKKEERKDVIGDIADEIVRRTTHLSPTKWPKILRDFDRLIAERHLIVFDRDPKIAAQLDEIGWSGRMHAGTPDKFMFVDANLAALKTDRVMRRSVTHEIFRDAATNEWRARVSLTYKNTGSFDWRTTRYNTYTRFYFPAGTRFIYGDGSQKSFKNPEPAPWDVGEELGHTSIGSFFVIEPGTSETVTVTVALAPHVVAAIEQGKYGLYVQKQLGTHGFELTTQHNFGTSKVQNWTGMITQDRQF